MFQKELFSVQLLLLLFTYFSCAAADDDTHVAELTDDNFKTRLEEYENTLVMFYAPWCGHCKKLKPEFGKAATLLIGHKPSITLAKVDCTEGGKQVCNDQSVSGYPTLKIFAKNEFVKEYNGPRDKDGIARYMKSQVGPASKTLVTIKDFKTLVTSNEVSVVGFFDAEDSSLAKVYQKVAKQLREKVTFAHTLSKEISEKEKYNNVIVLYRPANLKNTFEEDKLVYEGADSENDLKKFIENNRHGLVGVRNSDNAEDFKKPLIVGYYNVDYVKDPKGTNYWRNRIMMVAKDFKNEFNFAISNKDHFQHEINEFGIDYIKGDKPVILARDEQNKKYVLEGDFDVPTFLKFMQDLKANNLEPYLKSEAIPEDNSGSVKVAVAKNFDEIVTNNGKDTLIEFYAPWCGHCKKLAPIYDELGEKLANEDIEIVKFDATANDVPSNYHVQGFPTLFWVSKDSKTQPLRYEGKRELEDFIKYIAKHSTNELKGYDRNGNVKEASKEEL